MNKSYDFFSVANQLLNQKIKFVTITFINQKGSAPQNIGAKAIITEQGLSWGTIGGGKVEAKAIEFARLMLNDHEKKSNIEVLTWNLQTDIKMTCGGEVTFLFEKFSTTKWVINIFGAGHVSQALITHLQHFNCFINCIDSRREWISKIVPQKNIHLHELENPSDFVEQTRSSDFFVVLTKGHDSDLPILKKIFTHHNKVAYIGSIGSQLKAEKIKSELKTSGIEYELISQLHCPIGIDIGNNDPHEIAISIIAQLLKIRDAIYNS